MSIEKENPLLDISMFANYPQGDSYIPYNRPIPPRKFNLNIMTGETAIHSFEVPFNVSEWCSDVQVIYKYELNKTLIIEMNDLDIVSSDFCPSGSVVTCTLEPDKTKNFKTILDTRVQLRFVMKTPDINSSSIEDFNKSFHDGDIIFSDIYKVTVIESLED